MLCCQKVGVVLRYESNGRRAEWGLDFAFSLIMMSTVTTPTTLHRREIWPMIQSAVRVGRAAAGGADCGAPLRGARRGVYVCKFVVGSF